MMLLLLPRFGVEKKAGGELLLMTLVPETSCKAALEALATAVQDTRACLKGHET